jgi:hypothetical protein
MKMYVLGLFQEERGWVATCKRLSRAGRLLKNLTTICEEDFLYHVLSRSFFLSFIHLFFS